MLILFSSVNIQSALLRRLESMTGLKPPKPFDFQNAADWPDLMDEFDDHRFASGLLEKPEEDQPSSILAVFGGYLGFWLGLSIYSGVTQITGYVQGGIIRRLRNSFNKASVGCLFRMSGVLCRAACVWFCAIQARLDLHLYQSYPTAVMYADERMEGIEFPAVTLCMEKGFNFTRMCNENSFMDCSDNDSQRVVGSYLDVTVRLIEYSYSRDKVIYDCRFVSTDDACGDFDCADFWKPAYTHAFETICHTFDLARNRTPNHPYWKCPSPWKYSE
ncbi:uncharacterized protein ISCGN_016845 [Ixodes scapularis]